ncbi:MAG: hypothetical protein RLZZ298_588 [Pseudomonadota bacterium]
MNMTQPKTALITGITGQDGTCMAELVLEKAIMCSEQGSQCRVAHA